MSSKNASTSQPFAALGGAMSDSFELMRKAWGLAGLPSPPGAGPMAQFAGGFPSALPQMITPTLDVEEMDKRIADLKAVEQWLSLNMNMLRTTIQTLEVQRNTVATLKSYGGSMFETMMGALPGARANADRADAPTLSTGASAPARAAPTSPPPSPAVDAAHAPKEASVRHSQEAKPTPVPAAAMLMSPTVWWTSLQEQFAKIADAAGASAAGAAAVRTEKKSVAPRKKPRTRARKQGAPE